MKYDFYAHYWNEEEHEIHNERMNQIKDVHSRAKLYSLGLIDEVSKTKILEIYKSDFLDYRIPKESRDLAAHLLLGDPCGNKEILPRLSFFLHVRFIFLKPFLSKDDEVFYIHENPLAKEKVFKIPYIRASSWKGNLRWSALAELIGNLSNNGSQDERKFVLEERARIVRIFGNEKENKEDKIFEEIFPDKRIDDGKEINLFNHAFLEYAIRKRYIGENGSGKGRLRCYPTFFDRISLDIINPHDRETRRGKNPITLEVVPENMFGDLYLLYFPFGEILSDKIIEEMKEDLLFLCKTTKALLTEYGMSAKRTSGYGAARIEEIAFKSTVLKEYENFKDLDKLIKQLKGDCGKRTYSSSYGDHDAGGEMI